MLKRLVFNKSAIRCFSSEIKQVPKIEDCFYKTLGVDKEANQHDVR